jgi:heme/copper-type cytochrome/quinol oxidase subunit 3
MDRAAGSFKPGFQPPRAAATMGMWLFLVALFMLFAAGLLGYIVMRIEAADRLPTGVHIPGLFWLSTAMLLVVSVAIHGALVAVRRERLPAFRRWLAVMMAAAAAFLVIQTPAMVMLLASHRDLLAQGPQGAKLAIYGLIFFLVLVHAAHVIGGMIWLVFITVKGRRGAYDHESHQPIRYAAMYWHFLDVVWLVMFGTFLLLH